MRIIAGKFKGRRFYPPANNWPTRPTTDFAKEGLFNILINNFDFQTLKVLDLFGGTGSHSYEFISRGATDVTYVDNHSAAIDFVRKTAEILKIEDNIKIVPTDAFRFVERAYEKYDYIFADPPYTLAGIRTLPDLVFEKKILRGEGWFVLEHNTNNNFEKHPNFVKMRSYGKILFSFFMNSEFIGKSDDSESELEEDTDNTEEAAE
jgi:16S rRNA (guanine966-N2)-methyltransferase